MTLRKRMSESLQADIDTALHSEVMLRFGQSITGAGLGEVARAVTIAVGVPVVVVPHGPSPDGVIAYPVPAAE